MRLLKILLMGVVLIGCGKDDPPAPPESAALIFPTENSVCNTGDEVTATTSAVEFQWQASANTDSYDITVTDLDSNSSETINVSSTSTLLTINKGTPYSWSVKSKSTAVAAVSNSETWRFFNSGFETTYAPFPAEILSPENGASVVRNASNEITLSWSGSDADNDISGYDVYLAATNPPETLVESFGASTTTATVEVSNNVVYYWRVVTTDQAGNTSDSGVFDFRVN